MLKDARFSAPGKISDESGRSLEEGLAKKETALLLTKRRPV